MKNVLFLCSRNRLRSPTAERVFVDWPGVEVRSAGLAADAEEVLGPELIEWADVIFVMEQHHRRKLAEKFRRQLRGQRVICLNIPDEYEFMAPTLVQLLRDRVTPHLPR